MSESSSAALTLKQVADEAYLRHPGSCSHSVWHVIRSYLPLQPYMVANTLVDFLEGQPQWKAVRWQDVGALARGGQLVVGGLKEVGNGHVIVVYPDADKPAGGYAYTRGGKIESMRPRGLYAPAMSTSLSGWPGAKSCGDKTIWDPWVNDGKFAKVRFWKLEP